MSASIKTQRNFATKAEERQRRVTIAVCNDGKPGERETLMPGLGRGMVKHAWCELGRCALSLLHSRLWSVIWC
jgi:hypothetical protein